MKIDTDTPLQPCPFCGGQAELLAEHDCDENTAYYYHVECQECDASSSLEYYEPVWNHDGLEVSLNKTRDARLAREKAIAAWNQRPVVHRPTHGEEDIARAALKTEGYASINSKATTEAIIRAMVKAMREYASLQRLGQGEGEWPKEKMVLSFIKELQREYAHGSAAYNLLRRLETTIPAMLNSTRMAGEGKKGE